MSNLISLFGAIQYNGKWLIENPSNFFQDVSVQNIVHVRMVNFTYKGQSTNFFYILYQNPKGVTATEYLLPTQPNLLTLFEFNAGLQAVNSTNSNFTLYNNTFKTSNQPHSYFYNKSFNMLQWLVNGSFIDSVQYLPSYQPQPVTAVSVNVFNSLSKFIIYVTGDQNSSGGGHYFTAYGNV